MKDALLISLELGNFRDSRARNRVFQSIMLDRKSNDRFSCY